MKFLNRSKLILIISLLFNNYSFALTNNEIIRYCNRERNSQDCIRKMKIRRYKLERGNPIDIPIIPFKK